MCKQIVFIFLILLTMFSVKSNAQPSISRELWGAVDGKQVWLYTLTNSNGMMAEITNYGGIVRRLVTPDRNGHFDNVVLGFDTLADYEMKNAPYLGAIIGRFANRISNAEFLIDSVKYQLEANDFPNHSHGGTKGFDKVVWESSGISTADSVAVTLQYLSPNLEEGYPGNLHVKVTYVLSNSNQLKIYYEAQSDQRTIINLTHHSYFNLTGRNENILNHSLTIFADSITATDRRWIPTGEVIEVENTDFDFTQDRLIGERIKIMNHGYNLNYVLQKEFDNALSKAAELYCSQSGRRMEVFTTEPGLQL